MPPIGIKHDGGSCFARKRLVAGHAFLPFGSRIRSHVWLVASGHKGKFAASRFHVVYVYFDFDVKRIGTCYVGVPSGIIPFSVKNLIQVLEVVVGCELLAILMMRHCWVD